MAQLSIDEEWDLFVSTPVKNRKSQLRSWPDPSESTPKKNENSNFAPYTRKSYKDKPAGKTFLQSSSAAKPTQTPQPPKDPSPETQPQPTELPTSNSSQPIPSLMSISFPPSFLRYVKRKLYRPYPRQSQPVTQILPLLSLVQPLISLIYVIHTIISTPCQFYLP